LSKKADQVGALLHPNLPAIYTTIRSSSIKLGREKITVITELYVKSLKDRINEGVVEGRFIPEPWFATLVKDLICLFAFLQEQGISHGNVKPSNIMFT
jgi:serine/threonine protein kinase